MPHDNVNNHSAAFLVSSFLMSKRSLKSVYKLNPTAIAILRYLADSMDMYYKKYKKRQTKLYQSQIAKYCHCDRKTINRHLPLLTKCRLIKFDSKKNVFTVGVVLTAYTNLVQGIDVGQSGIGLRCVPNSPTSYSSNITNKIASPKNEKPQASVDNQSNTFVKDEHFKKASIESIEAAWIKQHPSKRPTRYKDLPYEP